MLLDEICWQRRHVSGGDMFLRRYIAGEDMLPEEICCRRRYVAGGDMLLEEICCWRRYVAGGDMLLEEICCQRRYVARGDNMLKKVSSQRRYLAKGETHHWVQETQTCDSGWTGVAVYIHRFGFISFILIIFLYRFSTTLFVYWCVAWWLLEYWYPPLGVSFHI